MLTRITNKTAQGKLLNAFDIVRIHKFGKQDTNKTETKYMMIMVI